MQGLRVPVLRLPLRLVAEAWASHASVASSPQWTQYYKPPPGCWRGVVVRTSSLSYWNGFWFLREGKLSLASQQRSEWW